ncbi:MAG: M1 family metallopeptidase [Bacteroidetes bacterium]|nr:M1 family metallopeptidase [Bacteroidota bacterium]MBU1717910.1 M1 family metallopeptidase [Bacteroidota bacterium]
MISRAILTLILPILFCSPLSAGGGDLKSLMDKYDMKYWEFNLNITNLSTRISGNVVLQAISTTPLDTFVCELSSQMTIDSILFNNTSVPYIHINDLILIKQKVVIPAGQLFSVSVFYYGASDPSGRGKGINNAIAEGTNRVTWTLSEPFFSYKWWPCKQDLRDKADSVAINLTTSRGNLAGSNGIIESVSDIDSNTQCFKWKCRYPIAFYLVFFAVSNYYDYSFYTAIPGRSDSLLVQNFVYSKNYATAHKADIDQTGPLLRLFSSLFGEYPFMKEKYGHCMTPGTAMEHQTMTTIDRFDFWLVAHEMSHHWFGDYVTCSNWHDIWLNEGFASYAEYIAYEFLKSKTTAASWLANTHKTVKTGPAGSIYVPGAFIKDDSRIFDWRLSYRKGASIIHILRYLINDDEKFFKMLRAWLSQNANSVASAEDFKKIAESETGLDLTAFFEQWYYGKGYPVYRFKWDQTDKEIHITINQKNILAGKPGFSIPLEVKIQYLLENEVVRLLVDKSENSFTLPIKSIVTEVSLDPGNNILCDIQKIED